ncbi:hypothetical protein BGW38_009139, partial [Lunasporangiospora selenospora]
TTPKETVADPTQPAEPNNEPTSVVDLSNTTDDFYDFEDDLRDIDMEEDDSMIEDGSMDVDTIVKKMASENISEKQRATLRKQLLKLTSPKSSATRGAAVRTNPLRAPARQNKTITKG